MTNWFAGQARNNQVGRAKRALHKRWHKSRGMRDPKCEICQKEAVEELAKRPQPIASEAKAPVTARPGSGGVRAGALYKR
jgi:hypothetical protein